MNTPISDNDPTIEQLAALADGELSIAESSRLNDWLQEHPEYHGEFADQESLSPENVTFWQQVAVPSPSAEQWRDVYQTIQRATVPLPVPAGTTRRFAKRFAAVMLSLAASLLIFWSLRNDRPIGRPGTPEPVQETTKATVDDDEPIVLATREDVELLRLSSDAHSAILVGRHPFEDGPLILAKSAELEVISFGPDDDGVWPNVPTPVDTDAPMIWVPSTKK